MKASDTGGEVRKPGRIRLRALACLGVLMLATHGLSVSAFCWQDAAMRYGLPAALLMAIAEQESGFNPRAINTANRNGTRDIGLMQINSMHLPTLSRFGIGQRELFDPCTNVHVGAWVLAEAIARHGFTWEAVGAYNAGGSREAAPHRAAYAWQIYRRLERIGASKVPGAKR